MAHATTTAESALPPLVPGPHLKRIGLISIVACFGGLLFGYHTGVSNGAERPMQAELGLTDRERGHQLIDLRRRTRRAAGRLAVRRLGPS